MSEFPLYKSFVSYTAEILSNTVSTCHSCRAALQQLICLYTGRDKATVEINLTSWFKKLLNVCIPRWPRELNALQLQKTHANRKSTSKSRKHFHHFDSRWCKNSWAVSATVCISIWSFIYDNLVQFFFFFYIYLFSIPICCNKTYCIF